MAIISSRQKGDTLIETMITLLIIAVGIIALIRFQNYLAYNDSLTQQQSEATILAMGKIESLRDFQVINTTSGYNAYQDIVSGTSTSSGTNATYTLTWTVTAYTNPTYKKIDMVVSWTDLRGNAASTRLISYVAGVDPSNSAAIY